MNAPEHLKEEIMKKVFLPELSKTEEKKMVPFAVSEGFLAPLFTLKIQIIEEIISVFGRM